MTNPIKPNEIFATPNDMGSLMSWIEAHTGSERAVAAVSAGMAWNLAAKLLDEQEANAVAFNEAVQEAKEAEVGAWDYWSPGDI